MASEFTLANQTQADSPSNGTGWLRTAHAVYNFSLDGGAIATINPKVSANLPKNAVIVGATINSTTAVTSAGASTMSVGTSAGSSATSILAATAKTSMSANALINGVPSFATPVKLTAAGNITVTIGTATQTAGVVEIVCYYFVANA